MTSGVRQAAWTPRLAQTAHSEQKGRGFLKPALGLPRATRVADATAPSADTCFSSRVTSSSLGHDSWGKAVTSGRRAARGRPAFLEQECPNVRVLAESPPPDLRPTHRLQRAGVSPTDQSCAYGHRGLGLLWTRRPGHCLQRRACVFRSCEGAGRRSSVLPEGVTRPGPQRREPCEGHPGALSAAQRAFLSSCRPGTAGHTETQCPSGRSPQLGLI